MSIELSPHEIEAIRLEADYRRLAQREASPDAPARARSQQLQREVAAYRPATEMNCELLKADAPRFVAILIERGLVKRPSVVTSYKACRAQWQKDYHRIKRMEFLKRGLTTEGKPRQRKSKYADL